MPNTQLKIIIANTNYLIRAGLKNLISENLQFNCIGEAASVVELNQLVSNTKVQLVIIEYCSANCFTLDELSKIITKYKTIHFLIISQEPNASKIRKVMALGIKNYLLTNCNQIEITEAILACAVGKKYFCSQIIDVLLEHELSPVIATETQHITEREQEIIRLTLLGTRPKEIARVLSLSYHTVATHKRNIYKKLSVNSVMELAQLANTTNFNT